MSSTGTVAVRQWISELFDKTSLSPGTVGEYTGDNKEILPVTVTTYQTLSGFSELISADILCTLRITKSSLSVYLNKSGKLEDIISFLKKKSSVPIPSITVLSLTCKTAWHFIMLISFSFFSMSFIR